MKLNKNDIRKRGSMLMDSLLAVGVVAVMVTMFAVNNQREAQSQQDRMMASRTEIITNNAKAYLSEQYDDIRDEMANTVDASMSSSDPIYRVLTMNDLADRGYMSEGMLSGRSEYGHEYSLIIRGVLRSDTNWPQDVITVADRDSLNTPDANGTNKLINGIYKTDDDEMDLEAVIITHGGEAIPVRRGGAITGFSGNPTMGYIEEDPDTSDLIASGNLGSFRTPIYPWTDLGVTTSTGHLLSLVSMTGTGASTGKQDHRPYLRRCFDLTDPIEQEQCLNDGNDMYSNVVFNIPDGDSGASRTFGDYPGMEGLKKIACRENDWAPATSSIGASYDGEISSGGFTTNTDMIYIDCADTVFSDNVNIQNGDLTVEEGDLNVATGNIELNGNNIENNLIMASGEGLNGEPLPTNPVTEMCPLRDDGTRMEYKVQAWVNGLIEPAARPISGYRLSFRTGGSRPMTLAANPDPGTGQFVADVITFINEDNCNQVSDDVLTPANLAGGMDLSSFDASGVYSGCSGDAGDEYPDAFMLNNGQARVSYAVYCE